MSVCDEEVLLLEFFPALVRSLKPGSDPFAVLDRLRAYGVVFRSAPRGEIGEDYPVEDISVAIYKARHPPTIKAGAIETSDIEHEKATVHVGPGPDEKDYKNVQLARLYVRREEVDAAYKVLGLDKPPSA